MIETNRNNIVVTAPDIDYFLYRFQRGYCNPEAPSEGLLAATQQLFDLLSDLAPIKENDEVKALWIMIPRGGIRNYARYTSYRDMRADGELSSYKEYKEQWLAEYPEKEKWYRLVLVKSVEKDGSEGFRAISFGGRTIVSMEMVEQQRNDEKDDEWTIRFLSLITPFVAKTMDKVRDGTYNITVEEALPYRERIGVMRRFELWAVSSEQRDFDWDITTDKRYPAMTDEILSLANQFLSDGRNNPETCGRMEKMTANVFFHACAIGYAACEYTGLTDQDGNLLSWKQQYLRYADGRTEGLTGDKYLKKDEGIPLDDPHAWDAWYFDKNRFGGHPWEVCRGGNSTHVDLFVRNDSLLYGRNNRPVQDGWYFCVAGKHRATEAVRFYIALRKAGYPVILNDSDEIMSRFYGTDYVGIVPHDVTPWYCESMFPAKYGKIIDFLHVDDENMTTWGQWIEWLPQEPARLCPLSGVK